MDTNTENDFLVKFDSSSGDILWSVQTEDEVNNYDIANNFTRNAVLSNGDILFFPYYDYNYQQSDNIIYKLNSSNGEVTTAGDNVDIPNRIRAVEVDNNDNIYISSQIDTNYTFYTSSLTKYDSNLNVLWNMNFSDNGSGNNEARIADIESVSYTHLTLPTILLV
mgnify:CR=1 FL=1